MRELTLMIISFLVLINTIRAQTDNIKYDCIENNKICDYLVENSDTIWKSCVDPYFPISDYLHYGEDCVELYWLYKYSFVLKSIDEKILYKEKKDFIRILMLKASKSKLILIERENSYYNITIKKFELDTVLPSQMKTKIDYKIDTFSFAENEYYLIEKILNKSDVYSVEAHPVQYFAFSDYDVICFESYGYGGYVMTDLYIPFIKHVRQYKGLLKFIEKIESKAANSTYAQ